MAISPETLRLVARLRARLADITDARTRALTEAWVRAWDELAAALVAGIDDLLSASSDGRWPSRAAVLRTRRLMHALDATRKRLEVLAGQAAGGVAADAAEAVPVSAGAQAGIIASQLPAGYPLPAGVGASALDAIVARTGEQVTALTRPLPRQVYEQMLRTLIRGVAVGDNPRATAAAMVRRVEGQFNGGLTRALVISRTETLDAYRAASAAEHQAHSDVLAGWVWRSSRDRRTCPACFAKDGTVYPLGAPGPWGHQQCLVPGAVVEGPRPVGSTSRWYRGEVVDIEVDGGHSLTVTPNHPVLTADGWVAAGELGEGSYVVCGRGLDRYAAAPHPDDYQVPALIEDVAQTLGGAAPVLAVRVPTTAEDFHGDGAGSEVHVVRADGLLGHGLEPSLAQQPLHTAFLGRTVGGDPFGAVLARHGVVDAMQFGLGSASRGLLRGVHDRGLLFCRSSTGNQAVGFAGRSGSETCIAKSSVDQGAGYAVAFGERFGRLAGEVSGGNLVYRDVFPGEPGVLLAGRGISLLPSTPHAPLNEEGSEASLTRAVPGRDDLAAFAGHVVSNRVLKLSRRSWQGHVYNLQTTQGWYLANGIVTHNCRCVRLPQSKSWANMGINLPEPPPVGGTARDVFSRLSRADQLAVMGPARLELLDSGRIDWADLAMRRSNPNWRPSYTPRPVSVLARMARPAA